MKSIIPLLQERGFIEALTDPSISDHLATPRSVYCGFDPTADSLHLGNLVPLMALAWFQRAGHTPIALIGGATALIGDPSGRSTERQLLDPEQIAANALGIKENLLSILGREGPAPIIVNNIDWFSQMSAITFLRDIGKHFRLGAMLGKESVRSRQESGEGMSFTEFSYQLLQANDFLQLYRSHNTSVQIGGSDQWGNITAGMELIRRLEPTATVYGATFPLLTRSDGQKFGKSESGALYLSQNKTSPYDIYQYLYRTADSDVCKLMTLLTFIDTEEINTWQRTLSDSSGPPNAAQKRLAESVIDLLHGTETRQTVERITELLAPGTAKVPSQELLKQAKSFLPICALPAASFSERPLIEIFLSINLVASRSEARRLIQQGGLSVNGTPLTSFEEPTSCSANDEETLLLLAVGKHKKQLVALRKVLSVTDSDQKTC